MKTNRKTSVPAPRTWEGGTGKNINAELELRRSIMACMLWEDSFYEDGVDIANRIANLVPQVKPETVAKIAEEARNQMKLRHVPLLLVREMCEDCQVYKFDDHIELVPPRHGFALADAIGDTRGGTYLGEALNYLISHEHFDRLIVVTDEQTADRLPCLLKTTKKYMINVAPYKTGVGYGNGWVHIDGFSEAVLSYIAAYETADFTSK